ncbi:VAMP-associated protein [Hypoxylon trugodes]|uniref:VAMP-associated protein n=1 Tax=Hypoxylon trugodes TaxID=326681 RepID=UPI00219A3588|nr:VAMP-associated protein [Hypoxylon trugodes]KAI1389801.1 VAMP-associated protein [Hypoxylon trugodes]
MSVDIDPQELGFHRPFTAEVSEVLRIKNPNTHPVAFKVKTTAPKQYCVRPNSGRVEPGKEVEVAVILQAMKQEPPPDTKCRDKFLVQSVPITGDKEFANLASIWDAMEKSAITEKKIRVVFLPPVGASGSAHLETPSKPSAVNGTQATPDVAPPAYSSPGEYTGSQAEPKSSVEEKDINREEIPSVAGAAAAISTTQNSDPSPDELKQQLINAEKVIAKLKQDQEGLRQRKTASADKSSAKPAELAQATRAGTEGVPVKLAAILCFLSFMLAYLFF